MASLDRRHLQIQPLFNPKSMKMKKREPKKISSCVIISYNAITAKWVFRFTFALFYVEKHITEASHWEEIWN